jgi:segregation and condensation protein A
VNPAGPAVSDRGSAHPAVSEPGAGNPAGSDPDGSAPVGFQVRLSNFEGPFDLLLQLIFAHRLDVTEVALHQVTDDFIGYTKEIGPQLGLDETTAFLVIAATLLDLKAARLLPAGQVEDDEDLALLEVRDLLFARLLQYRAFKHVAVMFAELEAAALRSYPRAVSLEDQFAELLPEVMLGVDADRFAQIAAIAFTPRPVPVVRTDHLADPKVSVPEQAKQLLAALERRGVGQWASFSDLVHDCQSSIQIVGRFLALLELYRARTVAFDQSEPLGVLQVSWTGERPTDERVADAVDLEEAVEERDQ